MIRLSGRLRSALVVGGQGIRARKLRTLLSMTSLFLGVLAVVVVQAAAETARRARLADLELQVGIDGTRQLYLPADSGVVGVVREALRGRMDGVAVRSMPAIIGEPAVRPVNPGAAPFDESGTGYGPASELRLSCDPTGRCVPVPAGDGGAEQVPTGQAVELMLTALTGDIRQFRPFRPVAGEWLDFSSAPSMSPRLVVNTEAAKGFARYVVPAEMRVDGAPVNPTPRIVGVVEDGVRQPTAYVRADELDTWLTSGEGTAARGPGVQVLLAATATETEQILRARLTANGVPGSHIHVDTILVRQQIARELALIRWIFLGVAALVLIIGAAGVLNVGLATVGERVEEFALRRALGTPRLLLAGIVLAETLLTGLLTAVAAVALTAFGMEVGGSFLDARLPHPGGLAFPWQAAVAGIVAGLAAGLLGGLVPAIRAARISIASVMRA